MIVLEKNQLENLKQIAKGIAAQFGSNCEVVVHELSEQSAYHSIVAIENGHVTGRKVGDGPSHVVLEALREAAAIPQVLPDEPSMFRLSGYGDSAINYLLRVWTTTADYWDAYFDILERVRTSFEARGIEMTYPHLNVHMAPTETS